MPKEEMPVEAIAKYAAKQAAFVAELKTEEHFKGVSWVDAMDDETWKKREKIYDKWFEKAYLVWFENFRNSNVRSR